MATSSSDHLEPFNVEAVRSMLCNATNIRLSLVGQIGMTTTDQTIPIKTKLIMKYPRACLAIQFAPFAAGQANNIIAPTQSRSCRVEKNHHIDTQ